VHVSAYELYYAAFGAAPDKVFASQEQHPYVGGEFVWTGWDYLGEPTPFYSSRSSYSGIIDLAFVTVTIADRADIPVPRAKNRIRFSIDGPGEIVATDNGDPTSFESFQSKERNAFNGLCLAIVRARTPGRAAPLRGEGGPPDRGPGQAGTITLKAQSEGLTEATVTLRSETAR
jgi:hypothetical protein